MGCTLAPLDAVRVVHNAKGKKDFRRIHQYRCAVPWRCLFHPKCSKFSFQKKAVNHLVEANRSSDNSVGRDAAFEYVSVALSGDVDTIDLDTAILQLKELMDRHSRGIFVPFAERIALINIAD